MNPFNRFASSYVTLGESAAERLSTPTDGFRTVRVLPPTNTDLPATLTQFVQAITEYQTRVFGLKNSSPIVSYEILRFTPSKVVLQFVVPTARLERKLRIHLNDEIPGTRFEPGTSRLPLTEGETIGGAVLRLRRKDVYPIETEFEPPPINSVVASLHRHAMRNTGIAIQIVFKPVTGQPLEKRVWHREAARESRNLRSDKVGVLPWTDREATPRERQQARRIDSKAGSPRYRVSIRVLILGAGEYTASRVKEVSGGFNVFASSETGQGFRTETVHGFRNKPIINLVEQFRDRRLNRPFQLTTPELAPLVSIPDREQENIETAG
jgi:hypothetical protein